MQKWEDTVIREDEVLSDGAIAEATLCETIGTRDKTLERFRFLLMFCAFIPLFGLPTEWSFVAEYVCGFVPLAFFILSGIFVLADPQKREERLRRTIKRTAFVFGILLIFYAAVSVWFYTSAGYDVLSGLKAKRLWFNFLALNSWPFVIGDAIWYVQSLLYAYLILYFLLKRNLLRYDSLLFVVTMLINVLSGEFCSVIHLDVFGYRYFPPNFFTRALPYLLLGSILARHVSRWAYRSAWIHLLGILAGIVLIFLEPVALYLLGVPGYYDHLVGMGVVAAYTCMLVWSRVIKRSIFEDEEDTRTTSWLPRWSVNLIYYLYQPAVAIFGLLAAKLSIEFFGGISEYVPLLTFVALLPVVLISASIENFVRVRRIRRLRAQAASVSAGSPDQTAPAAAPDDGEDFTDATDEDPDDDDDFAAEPDASEAPAGKHRKK